MEELSLTPADQRGYNDICGVNLNKAIDQLLENQHSLCSQPHHWNQSEVMDEYWHSHTASKWISLVNTSHKDYQHTANGYTDLNMELGSILIA